MKDGHQLLIEEYSRSLHPELDDLATLHDAARGFVAIMNQVEDNHDGLPEDMDGYRRGDLKKARTHLKKALRELEETAEERKEADQ